MRVLNRVRIAVVTSALLVAIIPATAAGAKGCCYSVEHNSFCLDYMGSYWKKNPKAMRLNCKGATNAKFLAEYCPTDVPWDKYLFGTCIFSMEKPFETFGRYYLVGGGGFNKPGYDLDTVRKSCEAVQGVWVWGRGSGKR